MRSSSPLRASLGKRRAALAKHLPKALTGDSHAVHQARVASRRLRETLPIVGADLDGAKAAKGAKKVGRHMRLLTRALGPVRELEVTLGMVAPPDRLRPRRPGCAGTTGKAAAPTPREKDPTARGREHVAAMLRRDLEKARERLKTEISAEKIADWLARMEAVESAIDPGDAPAAGRAAAGLWGRSCGGSGTITNRARNVRRRRSGGESWRSVWRRAPRI